jgi:hypothetical protein
MKTPAPPDPVIEFYARGVDRSLLRENLKLTPAQRLEKIGSIRLLRFHSETGWLTRPEPRETMSAENNSSPQGTKFRILLTSR